MTNWFHTPRRGFEMPFKTMKADTADKLILEWALQVQDYRLTLDKNRCVGCEICTLACPKEAIKPTTYPKKLGETAKKAEIDVNLAKCNFCGICDIMCPYGAIRLEVNRKHQLSVVEKESFPQLIRDIRIDESKLLLGTTKIEDICPLGLIQVSAAQKRTDTEGNIKDIDDSSRGPGINVKVQKEFCPCCTMCEAKAPQNAIRVRKFINGRIAIHQENCPPGCRDCIDVCPIKGTLSSETNGKISINETSCTYCGACKLVCPSIKAIELKRAYVYHTAVHSGAWNKAFERITSPLEMSKELKNRGFLKARESVKKRVALKEDETNAPTQSF